MNEKLTIYRVGFNGNDETEVDAKDENEAIELARAIAKENGLDFILDYIESCEKVAWVCVYRDTIESHNEDWNLSEVLVTEDFARQYFEVCKAEYYDDNITFDNWIMNYDADDTEDFYEYAMHHNAVLDVEHWGKEA